MEQDDRSRTPFIGSVRARAVWGYSSPRLSISHTHGVPASATRRRNPSRIESFGNVLRVVEPDLRISAMIGRTLLAARSVPALTAETAAACAALMLGLPSLGALRLRRCKRRFCPPGDQGALLFGERRIEMQNERIDIRPQFRNEEGHAMRHQAGSPPAQIEAHSSLSQAVSPQESRRSSSKRATTAITVEAIRRHRTSPGGRIRRSAALRSPT